MSSLNKSVYRQNVRAVTHAGTVVRAISAEKQLVRMTLANMLWEDQFYVDGKKSAEVIADLVKKSDAAFVSNLAIMARTQFKLRHVPLLLMRELARTGRMQAEDLAAVIKRPDEMGEFVSMYWNQTVDQVSANGYLHGQYRHGPARAVKIAGPVTTKKSPLSNQVKKGLAQAFLKFNEYSLAKWDKNSAAVSLRDVMFLVHPKPQNAAQEALFKRVAEKQLVTPDTWETQLSAGADKKETFERLMAEKKLGALAFLRNLRNMTQAGISESIVREYAKSLDVSKVLPFRYIAAARIVPQYEDMLEEMMFRSLAGAEKLPGKTRVLFDVSGSMFGTKISAKSDLDRFDAGAALAVLLREICENVEIFSFSNSAVRVPARRGFALVEAISRSQNHGGTNTGQSLRQTEGDYDRTIVFTDEAAHDRVSAPVYNRNKNYIVNVAAYQNGINHSEWTTISGFSEVIIDYIRALEGIDSLI